MKIIDELHPNDIKNELGNILEIKEEQKYLPKGRYVIYDFNDME